MDYPRRLAPKQIISVRVEHGDEESFMPRLTEQEQQEIIRFMEADKPLPNKYRFLLFAGKREVELVWNGKTVQEHLKDLEVALRHSLAAKDKSSD